MLVRIRGAGKPVRSPRTPFLAAIRGHKYGLAAGPGVEYDVRSELAFYGGHGNTAVNGLLRWSNMSLEDAVDSVRACGGKVEPEYIERMERWIDKAGRRE